MPSLVETCSTVFALVLAVVAAIMSAPGHADAPWQLSEWLQLSICPEADAMAGALGENPVGVVPP
jgi:hypothetical protein